MCHTLLLTLPPQCQPGFQSAAGPHILGLINQCSQAQHDDQIAAPLQALHQALSQPGMMDSLFAQLAPDSRALLSDINLGIAQRMGQQIVTAVTSPPTAAPPPEAPSDQSPPSPDAAPSVNPAGDVTAPADTVPPAAAPVAAPEPEPPEATPPARPVRAPPKKRTGQRSRRPQGKQKKQKQRRP
jgi:hypothetical protein